jgi:hypothetical protein
MSRFRPHSLARLRTQKAPWLACLLAMLFKLAAVSLCFADGLANASQNGVPAVAAAVSPDSGLSNGEGCVLGEVGGCHCTCAHSVPMPISDQPSSVGLLADSEWPVEPRLFPPAHSASLIRPPIA